MRNDDRSAGSKIGPARLLAVSWVTSRKIAPFCLENAIRVAVLFNMSNVSSV